jgi:hypothetical protein
VLDLGGEVLQRADRNAEAHDDASDERRHTEGRKTDLSSGGSRDEP